MSGEATHFFGEWAKLGTKDSQSALTILSGALQHDRQTRDRLRACPTSQHDAKIVATGFL